MVRAHKKAANVVAASAGGQGQGEFEELRIFQRAVGGKPLCGSTFEKVVAYLHALQWKRGGEGTPWIELLADFQCEQGAECLVSACKCDRLQLTTFHLLSAFRTFVVDYARSHLHPEAADGFTSVAQRCALRNVGILSRVACCDMSPCWCEQRRQRVGGAIIQLRRDFSAAKAAGWRDQNLQLCLIPLQLKT
eukprot:13496795-Alexandrium_andersonii.AAC.1